MTAHSLTKNHQVFLEYKFCI